MNEYKYAIITPAHNEAAFLPQLIDSIANQRIKPIKWLIVDDRSSDETWSLINKAKEVHSFIETVRINGSETRKVGANVVHVFEEGFKRLSIEIDFIVKMDADILLTPDYFYQILNRFKTDSKLGMASGKTYTEKNGNWLLERAPDTHVYGPCKTYRMSCFRDIGGLIPLLGWDILDGAKARLKGWKTRSFRDIPIYHRRLMGSAKGMIVGRLRTGRVMYSIRAHPVFVLGKSLYRAIERPYLAGLIIPLGFFASFITRPERLNDIELAHFLRKEQINRLLGKTWDHEELVPRSLAD
jgi:biofilm PGA synthesis N-glycosyltransferase PgaC